MIGFYVTMLRGDKVAWLLGPYPSREEAEGYVSEAARRASDIDPWAWFDAFGVTRVEREGPNPLPKGVLS